MILDRIDFLALSGAALAAVFAVAAQSTVELAEPAVVLALILASIPVLRTFEGRFRSPSSGYSPPVGGELTLLRSSLRSGIIGRRRIVAVVHDLERDAGIDDRGEPEDPAELDTQAFAAWLDRRLSRLEESS